MIEFLAALLFLGLVIAGHIVSEIGHKKRCVAAEEEAGNPRINWALVDARAKGFPY